MSTIAPTAHRLPAATVKRHVDPQPGSVLSIHDDESWPSDDVDQRFDMSSWYMGMLSPTRLTDENGSSRCGGDEVRVNYQHRTELSLTSPGWVFVKLSAQMYSLPARRSARR